MKHWATLLLTALAFTAHAQNDYNPFASIGKKTKILTASNGEFEEFNYDTIQRIGSVLINTKTRKIIKMLDPAKTFAKASDNSAQSRWYSPDPMSAKFYNWSPYNFAYNNPIRFNDPDGTTPGDFYDQQGNKIGTDGKSDGKNYVVVNPKDIKTVQDHTAATGQGGTTQNSQLSSTPAELPSATVRAKMGEAVTKSSNPSTEAGDSKGGMHEEGGKYGKDANGNDVVAPAAPGAVFKPGQPGVGVTPTDPDVSGSGDGRVNLENVVTAATMTTDGTFHVHPIGDNTTQFVQPPSNADLNNVVTRSNTMGISGNSYVLGAANNTVYIYRDVNGQGKVIATFPLDKFISIK